MRRVVLEDAFLDTIADGSLPILIAHSTVFLLAGLALFQICIRYARQKGTLGITDANRSLSQHSISR